MIPCKHWRECGVNGGGCCNRNAYRNPSYGVCLTVCKKYEGPDRAGIGALYRQSFEIPSHHQPRHATILTSGGPAKPLYLGDRIASVTKAVGIKPCGGCEKRRQILNKVDVKVRSLLGL